MKTNIDIAFALWIEKRKNKFESLTKSTLPNEYTNIFKSIYIAATMPPIIYSLYIRRIFMGMGSHISRRSRYQILTRKSMAQCVYAGKKASLKENE